jgi:hypothetical protein
LRSKESKNRQKTQYGYKSGDPYIDLLGFILKIGISDPWYYTMPCGRWWCSLTGLDPSALWKQATKYTKLAGVPYRPTLTCFSILANGKRITLGRCLQDHESRSLTKAQNAPLAWA